MNETCMCWGFSHGDGWFHLLDALCGEIQHHIDQHNKWVEEYGKEFAEQDAKEGKAADPRNTTLIPQVVATQVKEKFGGLRFYYSGGDERIEGIVQFAESLSYNICEECGLFDRTVARNSSGWIRTTCRSCVHPNLVHEHDENRDEELTKLWAEVAADYTKKEIEIMEKNDRSQ